MRSPTHVIGWELLRRHLWPLAAMGLYLALLTVVRLYLFEPKEPIRVVPPDGRAAALVAALSCAYFYYLAVFTFGSAGDLTARRSIFPPRYFTLPVATEALVRGPMLYGMATVGGLVFASTLHTRWPWGAAGPLLWPAVLAAALLGWTQALMWMPYGVRGVRVGLAVLCLSALDAVVLIAMYFRVSEPVMLAILLPQLPLAYLTACVAVAQARRGAEPDWTAAWSGRIGRQARPARPPERFASPERAQAWFEWRQQGVSLPAAVAMVLPVELALLWLADGAPLMVLEILVLVVITPPVMAAFTTGPLGVPPFLATRPLSTAALAAAKLKAAAWSALAAWLLIIVAVPLALIWSGQWELVVDRARRVREVIGAPRQLVVTLLVVSVLIAATWKSSVQTLLVRATGQRWFIRGSVLVVLAFLVVLAPTAQWIIDHKRVQAQIFLAIPWILAGLVLLRLLVAALTAVPLTRSGLFRDRELVKGTLWWVVAVFALHGVLSWLFSGPLIPRHILLLIAILLVPLVRVAVAPMALAWSRHR